MEKNPTTLIPLEEDTLESFSMGTESLSPQSTDETSSTSLQISSLYDVESLSCQTKKIRKKRTAYDKIDDEKRLQLFNSVHYQGETLKSAAKRLGINYSSAKSILHTFRKEGRILKKTPFERPQNVYSLLPIGIDNSLHAAPMTLSEQIFATKPTFSAPRIPLNFHHQEPHAPSLISDNSPSASMKGLVDGFSHLIIEGHHGMEEQNIQRPQIPPLIKLGSPVNNIHMQQHINIPSSHITIPPLNAPSNLPPAHPREVLKNLDNFYMNYSNSPLSGGKGTMFNDYSDSGSSRRYYPKEFESFSDMMNALQSQNRNNEELRGEIQIPKPLRLCENSMQARQEKNDGKIMKDETIDLNETIENAAIDTFRSLMDAQLTLCGALKKASIFNNLLQYQRTGISPINGRNNY